MPALSCRLATAAALLPLVALAHAQTTTVTAPPSPLHYRSTLADYRAFDEQPVASWITTNETVGKIGGWRAYAREAADAAKPSVARPPAESAPTATPPAASPPSTGHPGGGNRSEPPGKTAPHTGHGAKP